MRYSLGFTCACRGAGENFPAIRHSRQHYSGWLSLVVVMLLLFEDRDEQPGAGFLDGAVSGGHITCAAAPAAYFFPLAALAFLGFLTFFC